MVLVIFLSQEIVALLFVCSTLCVPLAFNLLKRCGLLWSPSYPFQALKGRISAYRFLFHGPDMIQQAYDKAKGDCFVVQSPDTKYIFVSSKQLIKELDTAPKDTLSLQGAAKTLLQPQYSMHKFDWVVDKGFDGTVLIKKLSSLLRNVLPSVLPRSRPANAAILDQVYGASNGKPSVSAMVHAAVAHTNAWALFGEIADDCGFMTAAVDYVNKVIVIAEAVRLLPSFIGPRLARFLENRFNSQKIFFDTLVPIVQKRLDEKALVRSGHNVPQRNDCIQSVMEQATELELGTAERIVHELMALWFGSYHTMSLAIIFALQDLCLHPEYVEPLRKEFESSAYEAFEATGSGLPLFDSFLKESARLSPPDSASTRRKALKSFNLSNGIRVERDQWVCTPLRAMLCDPQNWASPLEFCGFRHADAAVLASLENSEVYKSPEPDKAASMTDVRAWQTWGTGRMACPGRFYAVAGMKQILGIIVTKYDCELEDKEARRSFSWRTSYAPWPGMRILMRPRTSPDNKKTLNVIGKILYEEPDASI